MTGNMLGKAKEDGQVFIRLVSLVAKVGKIKVDMSKMRRQRETHLRSIGVTLQEMYARSKALDGPKMQQRTADALSALQRIEQDLKHGNEEIARLQSEFRQGGGKAMPPQPGDTGEV